MAAPEIIAILNCYAPATGANLAQIILRESGVTIMGDDAIARLRLGQLLNARLPAVPPAPKYSPHFINRRQTRRRDIPSHE